MLGPWLFFCCWLSFIVIACQATVFFSFFYWLIFFSSFIYDNNNKKVCFEIDWYAQYNCTSSVQILHFHVLFSLNRPMCFCVPLVKMNVHIFYRGQKMQLMIYQYIHASCKDKETPKYAELHKTDTLLFVLSCAWISQQSMLLTCPLFFFWKTNDNQKSKTLVNLIS